MTKKQELLKRLSKTKNAMFVKVDCAPRLSSKQVDELKAQGLFLYTFCETDDFDDIYLSYYPRYVNHYCDVISNIDLGVTDSKDGISWLSYEEIPIEEMECEHDFVKKLPPEQGKKVAKTLGIKVNFKSK